MTTTTNWRACSSAETLATIQQYGPIGTTKMAEVMGVDMSRLSASIANWYRDAKGEWARVHRERDRSRPGVSYVYRWDATAPKREPGTPQQRRTPRKGDSSSNLPVQTARVPVQPPEVEGHVGERIAAIVLWDTGDDVILLDSNSNLIRGRRVQ